PPPLVSLRATAVNPLVNVPMWSMRSPRRASGHGVSRSNWLSETPARRPAIRLVAGRMSIIIDVDVPHRSNSSPSFRNFCMVPGMANGRSQLSVAVRRRQRHGVERDAAPVLLVDPTVIVDDGVTHLIYAVRK